MARHFREISFKEVKEQVPYSVKQSSVSQEELLESAVDLANNDIIANDTNVNLPNEIPSYTINESVVQSQNISEQVSTYVKRHPHLLKNLSTEEAAFLALHTKEAVMQHKSFEEVIKQINYISDGFHNGTLTYDDELQNIRSTTTVEQAYHWHKNHSDLINDIESHQLKLEFYDYFRMFSQSNIRGEELLSKLDAVLENVLTKDLEQSNLSKFHGIYRD